MSIWSILVSKEASGPQHLHPMIRFWIKRLKNVSNKIPLIHFSNPLYFPTKLWMQFGLTSWTPRNLIRVLNPIRIKLWTRIHSQPIHFWKKWYYEHSYLEIATSLHYFHSKFKQHMHSIFQESQILSSLTPPPPIQPPRLFLSLQSVQSQICHTLTISQMKCPPPL